jgi:hypothetical protein
MVEMGREFSTNRKKRSTYRTMVENPEGKSRIRSKIHRWMDNIRMDAGERGWDVMDWMELIWLMIGTSGGIL